MGIHTTSCFRLTKAALVIAVLLSILFAAPAQAAPLPHPRIWLNSAIISRLQTARANNTAEWQALRSYCDSHLGQNIASGYQFLDWYAAVLNYGLAYRVSGNTTYGSEGVKYLTALLRDRNTIGDGGGAAAIHTDSGYVARDLGTGVVVGRDWLDGAPGMTTSLINECGTRLNDWITWYEGNGFNRDNPGTNYHAGYFTMVYTASIGLEGDANYQASWQTKAETLWTAVLTYMNGAGAKGDWLEGWNYAPWAVREYIGYPFALETGTTRDNHWSQTTWPTDLVMSNVHMLYPSRAMFDDNGIWSGNEKGDPRPGVCLMCSVMSPTGATTKGLGVWFAHRLNWALGDGMLEWEGFLYTDPSIAEVAPTAGNMGGLAFLMYGHSVSRSGDWSNLNATYVDVVGRPIDDIGLNTGEVKIGSRGHILLIDGRTYEVTSDFANVPDITGSHLYAPLQGYWHDAVTHNMDNVDSAYTYSKIDNMQGCYGSNDGSLPDVSYMRRDTAFLRPDFVAVLDTVNTVSTSNHITEKWFVANQPSINGATATNTVGNARLFTTTVNPAVSVSSAVNPGSRTPSYNPNEGFTAIYKVMATPTTPTTSNSILQLFETADSTQGSMTAYDKLTPTGFLGVSIKHATNPRVVLFATGPSPQATSCSFTFTPVAYPTQVLVVGMKPSTSFSVTTTGTTTKTVTIATGAGYTSTSNGALSFNVIGTTVLTITTSSLPADTVGLAYNQTLQAANGTAPYTWAISSGSLPSGLSLSGSTGAITGTPTTAGTSSFTAQVTDSVSATATQALSIVVSAAVSITTSSLPNGNVGGAYSQTLSATGGTGALAWSLTSGSLPSGLSLNASTGTIAGTPTASGTSSFTVKAADTLGASASRALSIVVNPAPLTITTSSCAGGTVGVLYSQTLTASGGAAPYTWAVSSGTLPTGLSLNAATGAITGTPSASGTSNFTARVTDNVAATATKALSIAIVLQGSGNTYYVATTGLDTNPGSSGQPWLTLQHAVDSIAAGDTIIVLDGTYRGCRMDTNSGTAGSPKTLKALNHAAAILNQPGASNVHGSTLEIEDSNYWVIQDLQVNGSGTADHGIDARVASHITVTNCVAYSSAATAIFSGFADYMLVQGCQGHGTGEHGIYMSNSADYGAVTGNTTWANSHCGIQLNADLSMGGDGTMSFWTIAKNVVYSNCSGGGAAINFDGASDCKILNNLLYGNSRAGIALYAIDGANGSSRDLIYNDTIVSPSSWCVSIAAADQGTNCVDNKVKNCILMADSGAYGSVIGYGSSMGSNFASDYNAVVDRFSIDQDNETIIPLSTWRTYGYDAHSFVTTKGALFVDPNNSNYHLAVGSPAINAGTTVTEVTDDLEGNTRPQGGAYDVGCYETAGSTPLSITTSGLPGGTVGMAYSQTLTAAGGTTPYTWSLQSGSLPAGLSLVASTGAISGTPTASGTSSFTAKVTDNASATATQALSIVVNAALSITTSSLPSGMVGTAYSQTLSAAGGTTPYTWSVQSGSLPAGLSLAAGTGVISGTATTSGTSSFTAKVTDNVGATATKALSIAVSPAALTITTSSLPNGTAGTAYSQTLTASGGVTPYSWSLQSGNLPAGLSLNASSGAITGTPAASGTSSFTAKVTDNASATATKTLSIVVNAAPPALSITTSSLPSGTVGAVYSQTLSATGGTTPYTWSLQSGSLPAGLSIVASTGVISGTPTANGTSSFTAKVTDNAGATATAALAIAINPAALVITTSSLPNGTVGAAYSQTLAASGGVTPYTWSMQSGTLPAGLSLNASTGAITGTPTASGTSSFTAKVTDNASTTATKALSITVNLITGDPTYQQASSDAETSTTSTAWQTKTSLQFTTTASDTYVILAFGEYRASGSSYEARVRLTVDGTEEGLGNMMPENGTEYYSFAVSKVATLSAAQHTLTVGYCTANAAQTTYLRRARIVAIRKATLEMYSNAADATINLTTTPTDFAPVTFTPATAGDYLFVFSAESMGQQTERAFIQPKLNSTIIDEGDIESRADVNFDSFASFCVATLPASSQTVKITAYSESARIFNARRFRVTVIRLSGDRFANYASAVDDTQSNTTSTTFVQKLTKTWTSGSTGNWLLLSSARLQGTGGQTGEVQVNYNTSTTEAQPLRTFQDGNEWRNEDCVAVQNIVAGGRQLDTNYRSSSASYTVSIRYAHEVMLPLDLGGTALSITTTTLPADTVGAAYNQTLAATGGTTPYTWSIMTGSLPAGVSLVTGTGSITGTPTTAGTSSFTAKVTDNVAATATKALSIAINAVPSITTLSLPADTIGIAYSQTLAVAGGTTPLTWAISSGSLPTGLSLVNGTGAITGTPTAAGTSSFTARITDNVGATATQALSIVINAAVAITTASLPADTINIAYNQTLAVTGGTGALTWSVQSGNLPAGLSLVAGTGAITGTPTASGTTGFTAKTADTVGASDTKALSIVINAAVSITTSSLPSGTASVAYNQTLAAAGGTTPYTWSLQSGSLPAGLSIVASTGAITGTPTATGTSSFTARITDTVAASATQALSIVINASSEPTYQFAASDGESSTSSTTFQTKTTLTFTPGVADDWIILGFAEIRESSTNHQAQARLVVDGTVEGLMQARPKVTSDYMSTSAAKYKNLTAAAHTITLQYASSNASATAYVRNARIVALRKASLALYQTASDSTTAVSTTLTNYATLTFTPAATNDYLYIYSAEISASTSNYTNVQALYDGTSYDAGYITAANNADYTTFMSFGMFTVDAAAHTATIAAAKQGGTTAQNIRRARIIAIQLTGGRFANYFGQTSDAESTTTSTAFTLKKSTTWPQGQNGNWLLLNSARIANSSTSYQTEVRSYLNSSTVEAQELRRPASASDYLNFTSVDVRNITTSRTVEIDYRTTNAAGTAKISYARLYQLPLD